MNLWVLDCSLAVATFLPDENSKLADQFFTKLQNENKAIVPSLWLYEISNVILVATRRKRISEENVSTIFKSIESFPIEVEPSFSPSIMRNIYELGKKHTLSIYDSAYLELCIRKNAGLGSLDEKLIQSAKKEKVKIFK